MVERALGLQWNVVSDQFGFKIVVKEKPFTRRGILSTVCSIYDPLGFAAPFIFQTKLFLQDLCGKKLDWDDVIPEEDQKQWKTWLNEWYWSTPMAAEVISMQDGAIRDDVIVSK